MFRKYTENKAWQIAILEADALKHINRSNRVQFYRNVLLKAVLSTTGKFKTDDNYNIASAPSSTHIVKTVDCALVGAVNRIFENEPDHELSVIDQTEFNNALLNLCNEMLKKISTEISKKQRAHSHSQWSEATENHKIERTKKRIKADKSMTFVESEQSEATKPIKTMKKQRKIKSQNIDAVVREFNMELQPKNYLFDEITKMRICQCCLEDGDVIKCTGSCNRFFHKKCMHHSTNEKDINVILASMLKKNSRNMKASKNYRCSTSIESTVCKECSENIEAKCFVCNINDSNCLKCKVKDCGCAYHRKCLIYWPQHKYKMNSSKDQLICPRHICHTCVSPDVKNLFQKPEYEKKLVKCILCPATYHRASKCIPAGSEILSQELIICSRHGSKQQINVNHCVICSSNGNLVKCKSCPNAFHRKCLDLDITTAIDEHIVCIECESGKLPLYGEIVWVKYGNFSWWPGNIIFSNILTSFSFKI